MEKNVEALAALLSLQQDVVKKAIEDDTLDSSIKSFKEGNVIYKTDDFNTLLANAKTEAVKELGSGDRYPPEVYNPIKGAVLEMEEKEFLKTFKEAEEFKGLPLRDMQTKTIAKIKSGKVSDEKDKLRIKELEDAIETEIGKTAKITEEADNRVNNYLIDREKQNAVDSLSIDAEGEKLDIQKELVHGMGDRYFEFKVEENKVIVSDRKTGDVIKDKLRNPLSYADVLLQEAPKWVTLKDVSDGGRGDADTTPTTNKGLRGIKDMKDFNAYLMKENFDDTDTVGKAKLLTEIKAANPDFKD